MHTAVILLQEILWETCTAKLIFNSKLSRKEETPLRALRQTNVTELGLYVTFRCVEENDLTN